MNQPYLKTENLSVGYSRVPLVHNIRITLERGEILALIGPNGAGKSTILRTLIRELAPVGGTILLEGKDLTEISSSERAKHTAAMQTGRVSTEYMTVQDVVSIGRYPYTGALGLLSKEDRRIIARSMEQLHISDLAERDFSQLSDGQRQRVLLARAVCQQPELLVLDEPTSYLDLRYQLELLSSLRTMAKEQHLAVILSLHEIELARRAADRILCIKNGKIVRYGTPEEIFVPGFIEELFDISSESWKNLRPLAEPESGKPETEAGLIGTETSEKLAKNAVITSDSGNSALPKDEKIPDSTGSTAGLAEPFEHYVLSGGKRLRCGYTTGTCAALAAQACTRKLLTGVWPEKVRLITPKGWAVEVQPEDCSGTADTARCAVRKDGGDDADRTHGMLIYAEASLTSDSGVQIDGGVGVGRVTKPGLDQPVGAAAINSVPRRMIRETVEEVCCLTDYTGGIRIEISAPEGAEIAQHTFNPMLGIDGGISILGTSGIVEPMSVQALIDTIGVELRQYRAQGADTVVLTPGNYGLDFLRSQAIRLPDLPVVRISNYVGDALDFCGALGFSSVLLVGHIGKLVKLAGGIMNTHSKYADCRTELFCTHAALCGGDQKLCQVLMDCATTDACIELLEKAELKEPVLRSLTNAIQKHLNHRADGKFRVGAVIFSNVYGELGQTETAKEMISEWNKS